VTAETATIVLRTVAHIARFDINSHESFGKTLGIDPAQRRGMTTTFTYRDLEAWKRGMDLVEHRSRFSRRIGDLH
jgi:hypothetical protein